MCLKEKQKFIIVGVRACVFANSFIRIYIYIMLSTFYDFSIPLPPFNIIRYDSTNPPPPLLFDDIIINI